MSSLALILFLPWFAVIGWVYWLLPKASPRSPARNRIDVTALILAFVLAALGMWLGMRADATGYHPIWKHVLACLYAYGAFLGVLVVAAFVRHLLWRRSGQGA